MSLPERSLASILQDILHHLQELMRAEIALAKREVAEDVARGRSAIMALAAGGAVLLIGVHFLLWAGVYALALRLPMWASALIVGGVFILAGAIAVSVGLKRWRVASFTPERTVVTMKENVEWAKQLVR